MEGSAYEDEDYPADSYNHEKNRGNMEEGRWKMWTARCDQVHRKEDDVTISEREKTYAKIKQFWIQRVGMRRVDKSMVEVYCK
jgi:hypothetical protein